MKHVLLMNYCPPEGKTYFLFGGGGSGYSEIRPAKLLEEWCLNNGATMAGRMQSFRYLTGSVQKPGVMISERTQIIYFPLTGIGDPGCIWICYNDVLSWHNAGMNTEICFFDGSRANVPVGCRVISGQMKRCRLFLDRINSGDRFPVLQV